MPFQLTDKAIDVAALLDGRDDPRAGARVTFEGRVRDRNDGRAVVGLEYEAYGPLAEKEGERILAEAGTKFDIIGSTCLHRTGRLALGELAVWVSVLAGHRAGAFEACRYIIDETKKRVPIWKKEHYAEGATEWINSATGRPEAGGEADR